MQLIMLIRSRTRDAAATEIRDKLVITLVEVATVAARAVVKICRPKMATCGRRL
jgi:hypothetical protein